MSHHTTSYPLLTSRLRHMICEEEAEPLMNKSSCPDTPVVEARSGRFASCDYQATGTLHSACHPSMVRTDRRGGARWKTRQL